MSGGDIESGAGNNFMTGFFEQVADIKRIMEQIKANIKALEDGQSKALTDVYGGAGMWPAAVSMQRNVLMMSLLQSTKLRSSN